MAYTPITPYADRTYGDLYFGERLGAEAWDNADDATKDKALKQATLGIDQLSLVGYKCDEDQAREFPRTVDDCDSGDIPDAVSMACCEVAIAYLEGKTPAKLDKSKGKAAEQVGDASVTFEGGRGAAGAYDDYDGLPSRLAAQLLAPWIADEKEIDLTRV